MRTREAEDVKWSSAKDTLDLFMHKSFEYLRKADYIPGPKDGASPRSNCTGFDRRSSIRL
jgi:hypothetical protein